MGTVYRKQYTKPLPPGAKIITRRGKQLAEWVDGKGKRHTASVVAGKDGQLRLKVVSRTYVAKYRDGVGIVREVSTGCRTEAGARAVLVELERHAERVRAGLITTAEAAAARRQQLALSEHIDAFIAELQAKGCSSTYIANAGRFLQVLCDQCGFGRLGDVDTEPMKAFLAGLREAGRSARTQNAYREVWVAFGNWCVKTGRSLRNPFALLPKADQRTDRRRQRRALSLDELQRLLYVARWRPLAEYGRLPVRVPKPVDRQKRASWTYAPLRYEGLPEAVERARKRLADRPDFIEHLDRLGRERMLIYKTLALTGLRKGELASLTIGQLFLDADPPHVVLHPKDEKSREGNAVPLRRDLAGEIRSWLLEKAAHTGTESPQTIRFDPEAVRRRKRDRGGSGGSEGQTCQQLPAFPPLPNSSKVFNVPGGLLRVFDRDLAVAGIPKVDASGRSVDVHSLRYTFGTLLSQAGVPPRVAQAAMRHSTIELTMNVYTDPRLLDVGGAVEALPPLDVPVGLDKSETAKRGAGNG